MEWGKASAPSCSASEIAATAAAELTLELALERRLECCVYSYSSLLPLVHAPLG